MRYREELGLARRAAQPWLGVPQTACPPPDEPWLAATRAATNLLERTVALLPTDDPARDLLLVDLGDALAAGGGFEAAEAMLAVVATRALAAGDELTRSHTLVQGWFNKAAYRGRDATARRDALEGIERFEAVDDDLGLARGWRLLADLEWAGGQGAAAEAAVLESMAHARRAGALRELGRAYGSLSAYINTGPTSVSEGLTV